MNIVENFADYLEDQGVGVRGEDIHIGEAPDPKKVPGPIYWLVGRGGNRTLRTTTGESIKSYQVDVFYKGMNYKDVYDKIYALEELLNCSNCGQIGSFDTIDIEASTFPIDNDLDSETRKIGLIQANLTIYKECNNVS